MTSGRSHDTVLNESIKNCPAHLRKLFHSDGGEMELVDVLQISIPVGNVTDYNQINEYGQ